MDRVIILSNSPGEVSGWVKPVAGHLAALHAADETLLAVLPCPYASGAEEKYGAEIDGIDRSMRFVDLWKKPPKDSRNLVLQLGGEPAFGAVLAALFGAGWAFMGFCPGTSVGALGEGRWHAFFAIAGMIAGAGLYAYMYPALKDSVLAWSDWGKIGLPETLGINAWLLVALFWIAGLSLFAWFEKKGL